MCDDNADAAKYVIGVFASRITEIVQKIGKFPDRNSRQRKEKFRRSLPLD
jgi:hypothetical protein